jgi:hypothetical protein
LREDDAQIIQGLVKHLKIAEELCRALDGYTNGEIDEAQLMKALVTWREESKTLARL